MFMGSTFGTFVLYFRTCLLSSQISHCTSALIPIMKCLYAVPNCVNAHKGIYQTLKLTTGMRRPTKKVVDNCVVVDDKAKNRCVANVVDKNHYIFSVDNKLISFIRNRYIFSVDNKLIPFIRRKKVSITSGIDSQRRPKTSKVSHLHWDYQDTNTKQHGNRNINTMFSLARFHMSETG